MTDGAVADVEEGTELADAEFVVGDVEDAADLVSDAQELLDAYRETERELQDGEFDAALMSDRQDIQADLSDLESVKRHREAREAFEDLLGETNDVETNSGRQSGS